jgi:lipopolysaccharide/colanic/teichoic acid biosynthesis glycosyltransferase
MKESHSDQDQNATSPPGEIGSRIRCPATVLHRLLPFLHFPLPFSERRLLLSILDLLALNGALLLTLALKEGQRFDWRHVLDHPMWFVTLTALWLPLAYVFDAYDLRGASRISTAARAVLSAGLPAALICVLVFPSIPPASSSWLASVVVLPLLVGSALLCVRALYVTMLVQPAFDRRALIIGAGWAGRTIAQALADHGDGTLRTVGFMDDDPAKLGTVILPAGEDAPKDVGRKASGFRGAAATEEQGPLRVVGDRNSLHDLVLEFRITTLVLAITHEMNGELLQNLMDCVGLGLEVVPMPVLYEQLTGRVPVEHVGDNWYVAMPIEHRGTGTMWPMVKRLMDIVLSSIGLLLLGLATPVIALAIKLDDPGPVFYSQERVGKGGRVFRAYKFRSMVCDAEKDGAVWAKENDTRVTRAGRLLRGTHIDEFPQFLNILKGEMSAVGPRPERPQFVAELGSEIPFFRVRHAVRPGMAGWALVKHGYGGSREATLLKLQYDLYYIKHQSFWLDVVILLKTLSDSLALKGR